MQVAICIIAGEQAVLSGRIARPRITPHLMDQFSALTCRRLQ